MKFNTTLARLLMIGGAAIALGSCAANSAPIENLAGVSCETPPVSHCPDEDCPGELIQTLGNTSDPETGREFFLDYPCDLRTGDEVLVVLNLHGGGSIANWQRHYFPILDYKDQYNLVVITPSGSNNGWNASLDDPHLHNIVNQTYAALEENDVAVKGFWLAGHSFGGQTSNRLINDDPFFRDRLTGWVSLSGGRLGSTRAEVRAPIPRSAAAGPPPPPPAAASAEAAGRAGPPPGRAGGGAMVDAAVLPDFPFTFIYETGEHELTEAGMPDNSPWAERLGCDTTADVYEVVDDRAGYVYDTRQSDEQRNPVWGYPPSPGTAEVRVYDNCEDGRIVADIIRINKGHTEGLEPAITEEIVKMMVEHS